VRTAFFNGLLTDAGIVGMAMLFSLFAISIMRAYLSKSRQRPVILVSLIFLMGWLFISSSYDTMIFYFALMPHGPLMTLLGSKVSQA
jgi:hypothetical protein